MGRSNNTAVAALLAAFAILLGYVEFLIPVVPPIAGIKLGLGNIAVLAAMLLLKSDALAGGIMLTKVTLTALLFSGIGGFAYSLAGGVFSLTVMAAARRCQKLSAAGISCAGGAAHMAAQVMVAACVTSATQVLMLLPVLAAVGTLTGFLNGMVVNLALRGLRQYVAAEGVKVK